MTSTPSKPHSAAMRKPSSVFGKKLPVERTISGSATAAKVEGVELIDLTPTAMAAGGDALARLQDGRVVFVSGALPGEVVRCRVVSTKKDYARAEVVDVVSASADRVRRTRSRRCVRLHVVVRVSTRAGRVEGRDRVGCAAAHRPVAGRAGPTRVRRRPAEWPRRTTVRSASMRRAGAPGIVAVDRTRS